MSTSDTFGQCLAFLGNSGTLGQSGNCRPFWALSGSLGTFQQVEHFLSHLAILAQNAQTTQNCPEVPKAETCRCARQLDSKCSAGIHKPAYWGQQASQLAISSDWNILKLAWLSTWLAGSTGMTACCFSGDIKRTIQLDPSWQNWSKGEVLHKCIYYLWSQRSSSESQFSLSGLHKYNKLQKWL